MVSKTSKEELSKYLNNFIADTTIYSIIVTDIHGNIVFFNKGAQDLFDYKLEEAVGKKNISDLISKHLPKKEFVNFLRHVAKKGSYGRDLTMVKKNKNTFTASFRLAPIKNKLQKIIGYAAFTRDLSYKSKIDKNIRNIRNMLEVMFDSIPDDICIIDKNFKLIRANKAFLNNVGKEHFDQILKNPCYELLYVNKKNCKNCPAKETFKTGKPASRVFEYKRKDSTTGYKEIHTFPIKNQEGKVVQIIHHSKDITARKSLEKKIIRQNARLLFIQEIGESMHSSEKLDELLRKILNSILKLGFNRAALYLTSTSENQLKGVMSIGFKHDVVKDISLPLTNGKNSLISQVFLKKEPIFVRNVFDPNNKIYVPEKWLKTFEGDSILVLPLLVEDEVIGILTVDMRDKEMRFEEDDIKILELFANNAAIAISRATLNEQLKNFNERLKKKIKEATSELSLKNRRLEELDRMKNQFLSTISHELKTPLTSITGYSSLLKARKLGELTEEQKKGIDVLNQEAQRLNELITNLLDLAKLETGKVQLKLEETDINELIESVIHDMREQAFEKGITVYFNPIKLEKIELDPSLIELAFRNLISNAIKYNKQNGKVEISMKEEPTRIIITIKDSGRGIKRKKIAEIFDKFHQLEEHTIRYTGGTGIGLAIVKAIVDKHNGFIKIRSRPRKETSVSFSIPKNLIIEPEEEESYRLRRTIDELKSVRTIFNIMHSEKSLKEILMLILEEIHKTIGFDRIRLYLLDKNRKILRGTVAIGTPNIENVSADIKKYRNFKLIKSMMENKQAEIIEFQEKSLIADKFDLAKEIALMPLIVKGNVIGAIAADNLYSKKEITDEDLKSLTIFANSAAIGIENFRLYEETEQKVKKRTKELVKINKQKDEFLGYVSHELRTPLTSLLGYSKLLLSKKLDKKVTEESIKIIFSESERLKNMINNFLELSKIEAGKVKLEKSNVDLIALAKNVRDVMKKQAEEKGLKLLVGSKKIPKMKCDKDKIKEVLLNLVSNGIKFTKKGYVKIIMRDKTDIVEIEVKDTGIGIAKKDYAKVFSKFEQIKNELKTEKGTGLGMPIAKQLVELHKGKIWIESKPKKGSSFIFTLPKT